MNDERIAKLHNVLEDDEVVEKVANANSAEELKAILMESGIEFTDEEIELLRKSAINALSAEGELDEAAIENVAGGIGVATGAILIGGAYVAGRVWGWAAGKKLGICWR